MSQKLEAGDVLVFQIEAGYGLLRLLGTDEQGGEKVFHIAAYSEFFPDVETAETAAATPEGLNYAIRHAALTERAFESTQVARIGAYPLGENDIEAVSSWRDEGGRVTDRSIRLLLGMR